MIALPRILAPVFALCLAACVTLPSSAPTAVVTSHRAKAIPAERTQDSVVAGKSTRADVLASLGETLAIRFDSGYEVWVYRLSGDTPARNAVARSVARSGSRETERAMDAEFVILFAPSGLVAKTRISAAPQPQNREGK